MPRKAEKNKRYYTLHEKRGKRWLRLWEMAFTMPLARRIFAYALTSQQDTRPGPNYVPTTGKLMLRPIRTTK